MTFVFDKMFEDVMRATPEDLIVWRGASIPAFDDYSDVDLVGRVFQDDAFLSTSLQKTIGLEFVSGRANRGKSGLVLFEIRLPAGETVLYTATNEDELILDRGQSFKIIAVGHIPGHEKDVRHIVLEPMGKGTYANTIKSKRIRMMLGGVYRSVVGSTKGDR